METSTPATTSAAGAPHRGAGTALLTDRYELTMLEAARRSGLAERRSVFEVFARSLPPGRRYGVVCGLGRLLDAIGAFRFTPEELDWLVAEGVVGPATAEELASFRFTGDIAAYPEGELYFPGSPVLTVQAPFGQAVLLETLVLSVLNHDTAVASAAARVVAAAGGRPVLEMGSRRTHEEAAVAAARAAWVAGFAGTSNLAAGRRYGIPTVGTVAHAFIMGHASEAEAFAAQVAAAGPGTTLLVDTFDVERAIRTAVEVAGPSLGAIRLDSGDLAADARSARRVLDELGATGTRIVASGDLDERRVAALGSAPVDAYGVGTAVVTGSGEPTAGFIYKLVARADTPGPGAPLRPVAKRSLHKETAGGRKTAWRLLDEAGVAWAERLVTDGGEAGPWGPSRPLQVEAMTEGEVVRRPDLGAARDHHTAARAELRPEWLLPGPGPPALVACPWPPPPGTDEHRDH